MLAKKHGGLCFKAFKEQVVADDYEQFQASEELHFYWKREIYHLPLTHVKS
jgi:hypothetical protein